MKNMLPLLRHQLSLLKYYQLSNIRTWLPYGFDLFTAVEIETTTACNRRCAYCPNAQTERGLLRNQQFLDEAIFLKLLTELQALGFRGRISPHLYGEPLLDARLPDLLAQVKSMLPQARVVLFSNGDLLSLAMYHKLVQVGVKDFHITGHEGNARPSAQLAEVFAYREQHGAQNVKLKFSVLDLQRSELYNRAGAIPLEGVTPLERCFQPTYILTVDYQGNVILCCNDYFGQAAFGNLRDEAVMQIWRKKSFANIRRALRNGVMPIKLCQECGRGYFPQPAHD